MKAALLHIAGAALAAVTGASAAAQSPQPEMSIAQLTERIAELEQRVQREEDKSAIEKLTRAYGYYVDKQLWDQVGGLFTTDARVEIAGRGVYRGTAGVDRLFREVMGGGQIGLRSGALFNHLILQGIVDVQPDGKTALGRWRAFVQIGRYERVAIWSEGTYENRYVKEDGVWKIADMHFYATYYTPFDKGWRDGALPNNGPSSEYPPDEPQSVEYDVFPGHYVPPFHYPNPGTGEPWSVEKSRQYSTAGEAPAPAPPPGDPANEAATPNSPQQ